MDLKTIAQNITAVAPAIGTAIGGPVGSVVGLGVQALAKVFGLDATSSDIEAQLQSAVLSMTPEQAVALKKADNQFKVDMKKLDIDVFKLEVADRDSARQANKTTYTPVVVTYMVIIIAGYMIYEIMTSSLDTVDKTLVGAVIGYVFGELKQITGYWFGSSKGSKDKTDALATAITNRK